MTHLLDANALIALAWPRHEHHDITQTWFKRHAREGWATSALTQSAFVRIVSQPAFEGQAIAISDVAELLLRNTAHPHHVFLALDFGFEQVLGSCTGGLHGHRHVTDAYLLTLAMHNKAKLLTFDGGLPQLLASPQERQKHITLLA